MSKPDLVEESDRGALLLAVALLDESLKARFRTLAASNGASQRIQDSLFDANGPLATFSGKAKIAYAVGLIDAKTYYDLEAIRRVRNNAAHDPCAFDLLDDETGRIIETLHCVKPFVGTMRRYSPKSSESTKSGGPSEAELRVAGLIKYRKAMLSLGVGWLLFAIESGIPLSELPAPRPPGTS